MITRIQKIISYIIPITLEKCKGDITPQLEVTIENGIYVLNTKQVNYSFGGLHKVFEYIFEKEKIEELKIKNVLILGFGAGDVADMLLKKYRFNCSIIGVEKDPVVIKLTKKYFNIQQFNTITLLNRGAFDFVQSCEQQFDLIVIDVFVDAKVPKIIDQESFLCHIKRLKANSGIIFFNRPFNDEVSRKQTLAIAERMNQVIGKTSVNKIKSYGFENCVLVHRY